MEEQKTVAQFGSADVDVLKRERGYDGFFKIDRFTIRHRLIQGGWSEPVTREILERGEAVGVLPYDLENDRVCLIRQFRAGMLEGEDSFWPYEIVAGMMDIDGESREQVGLEPILSYWVSPGGTSERMHLYCALVNLDDVRGVYGNDHEGEDILVTVIDREEAMRLIDRGEINNAATLVSLLWLEKNRDELVTSKR